jgi:hypothetical protein
MTLIQSLYPLFKWFLQTRALAATKCPLLELPDELILCITGHLAPHDKFLLSQTCRAMQRLASRDWNEYLCSRTPSERNEFFVALAHGTPNHWACENCGRLHAIDRFDLPSNRRLPPCVQPTDIGARVWANYYLEHHHIQLALKLSGRKINRSYLKKLLITHHYSTTSPDLTISYLARPKIVEGHFLLCEKIAVGGGFDRVTYSRMAEISITLCPHLAILKSPFDYRRSVHWLYQTTRLYQTMARAIRNHGIEIQGSCEWCPTDYSVIYVKRIGQLTLSAWHDFGAYGSVSDPHWSSQMEDHQGQFHRVSAPFNRELGGCRAAYLSGRL